ncbi:signal recognition particle receptor alpha subunit Srp101 [Schizosaccharomyces cryophilus OY26]|uniref:Signal recognition particle receptor subunit alpha homolog n=1 Tax=Schizosaccharomyces cryophilus (strain OY26 / ATCC MYA-4695 / CBS 11777 / NBRC 106824 / NRRL Y48691) TaxID=653667 RepID=S9XIV0_SCHCR|nr:signal recognition particle receptor alpha subunit Srp101 [Schizosaccharomyces cryophilus OY26]EPY53566.1 signal recognition particle receptor alpha subunit Srp101 [Schizosaccharomyces cryophilus OY26]
MLDLFAVTTKGGIVLWKTSDSAACQKCLQVLFYEAFLSERRNVENSFHQGRFTIQFQESIQNSIVFVVAFQDAKAEAFTQTLLNSMHNVFINLFQEQLQKKKLPTESDILNNFVPLYNAKLAQLSKVSEKEKNNVQETTLLEKPKAPSREKSRNKAHASRQAPPTSKKGKKELRKWDDQLTSEEQEALNYSGKTPDVAPTSSQLSNVIGDTNFQKTKKGDVVIGDLEADPNQNPSATSSTAFSFFSGLIGGKYLKEDDLDPVLKKVQEHLIQKNVANSISLELCKSVKKSLIGKKVGSFESVKQTVNAAFRETLTQILTPSTSLDLLHSIRAVQKNEDRPYTISLIGVNGVGKSTTLAKLAYWLLSNNFRILVAACDTFRSGAIEQLGVHVRNLQSLKGSSIELFAQGYGKDSSFVVKNAVEYAKKNNFDVILIDTAGRRHNDQRLMGSLEKFTKATKLDKIFQVAEALVGTDSLAQAKHFQASLYHRPLDGFIISKVDTVGKLVGVMVGMVYSVRVPIVFVGVGQMYSDLRTLSVDWVVDQLMK